MSKLISGKCYLSYLPNNEIAVSFITKDRYAASQFVKELEQAEEIEVSAREFKRSRSLRQNDFMWAIISKISDAINGERSQDSLDKIYGELLVKANVKRELMAVLPEAIDKLKSVFRAVIETGQTIESVNEKTGKKATLKTVWCYYGSSKLNTKEMSELMEHTLKYASSLGVSDSEIDMIRSQYEK